MLHALSVFCLVPAVWYLQFGTCSSVPALWYVQFGTFSLVPAVSMQFVLCLLDHHTLTFVVVMGFLILKFFISTFRYSTVSRPFLTTTNLKWIHILLWIYKLFRVNKIKS